MIAGRIGVFDSGVGGLSVARAIEKALPGQEVVFVNDAKHLPYGTKSPKELLGYVEPILQELVKNGCQVIVIACNTVSTTLIDILRERITVPLIAVEPMVKSAAALTKSNIIVVCATPTTLASTRYRELKRLYASNLEVIEPDCSQWTTLIESDKLDNTVIAEALQYALDQGADIIVLGCTHYHWIEERIKNLVKGQALVIQPEQAVIRQLKQVLLRLT